MAERVQVREIDDDEGRRLLRTIRRGTGSVVTWRRAQVVLLSARGMPVAKIAEVTFTSPDRVRDVLHNFNADGFESLYPKYKGGRPRTFTLSERRETKNRSKFLEFCRYLRSLHPANVRIAIVCDNYSPHLTTKRCQRVATRAAASPLIEAVVARTAGRGAGTRPRDQPVTEQSGERRAPTGTRP